MQRAGWERAAVIRPAVLQGRRVDFWDAQDWLPESPDDRPQGGYWLHRGSGRLLVALGAEQSLRAAQESRQLARPLRLCLREARAAEAGRALGWTSCLTPVPLVVAESLRGTDRPPFLTRTAAGFGAACG